MMNLYRSIGTASRLTLAKARSRRSIVCLVVCFLLPTSQAQASWSRNEVMQMVVEEADRQHFSPALALAVAKVESDFNPLVESHVGARGVMQIMPKTAEEDLGIRVSQLYNPRVNINGGIRFLKHLVRSYDGRIDIALSHYNGGSRVRRDDGSLRVLPATKAYVNKVMKNARKYRAHPLVVASNSGIRYASLDEADRRNHRDESPRRAPSSATFDDLSSSDLHSTVASNRWRNSDVASINKMKRQKLVRKLEALVRYNQQRDLLQRPTPPAMNTRSYRKALVAQWENI